MWQKKAIWNLVNAVSKQELEQHIFEISHQENVIR